MRPDGDLPCQVCSPQYDTECKTVQDEKCEIRSVPKIILFIGRGWRFVFRRRRLEYVIWGRGRGLPTLCWWCFGISDSINFLYVDGPGTRTSARRNTRPSAKHSTTRSAMMCRWETRPKSTHWPFLFCHCCYCRRRHQRHPILLLTVLSSTYSSS